MRAPRVLQVRFRLLCGGTNSASTLGMVAPDVQYRTNMYRSTQHCVGSSGSVGDCAMPRTVTHCAAAHPDVAQQIGVTTHGVTGDYARAELHFTLSGEYDVALDRAACTLTLRGKVRGGDTGEVSISGFPPHFELAADLFNGCVFELKPAVGGGALVGEGGVRWDDSRCSEKIRLTSPARATSSWGPALVFIGGLPPAPDASAQPVAAAAPAAPPLASPAVAAGAAAAAAGAGEAEVVGMPSMPSSVTNTGWTDNLVCIVPAPVQADGSLVSLTAIFNSAEPGSGHVIGAFDPTRETMHPLESHPGGGGVTLAAWREFEMPRADARASREIVLSTPLPVRGLSHPLPSPARLFSYGLSRPASPRLAIPPASPHVLHRRLVLRPGA
jgi:hypothetical protein